jgi:hypothetical protein
VWLKDGVADLLCRYRSRRRRRIRRRQLSRDLLHAMHGCFVSLPTRLAHCSLPQRRTQRNRHSGSHVF